MAESRELHVRENDLLLLVGTVKGAFLLRSSAARSGWEIAGPWFQGQNVDAIAYDDRAGRRRLWASTLSWHWGPGLAFSDDFGRSWDSPEQSRIRFPEDLGVAMKRVWQIVPGRAEEPDTLYAGVEPAALFESRDAGLTWSILRGLWDHPHRPKWQPGGGGLGLHTILPDPANRKRMMIAISAGGCYRTDDGGASWEAKNRGIRAEFMPEKFPEFGQCVHKIVQHPDRHGRYFLQNHWGLYRSDDAGDSWQDVARDVPSDFGFAMAAHPQDADVVYIVPIESDQFRCTPEGRLRVYRTRDGAKSWEPLSEGLPQEHAYETILRDALACDTLNPAGVYFGTRSGKLFGSADGGASWSLVMGGLPAVLCVKTARVGAPATRRTRRARGAQARPSATDRPARGAQGAKAWARSAATRRAPARAAQARRAARKRARRLRGA